MSPCAAIDLENTALLKLFVSLGLKLINVDGDVSQNPTHHHMPGKQNRTKFPLSAVRPSASNKIECSWVRYLDKQKSDSFMFGNRKLIRGEGRGNWKLDPPPPPHLPSPNIRTGEIKRKKIMHVN